MMPTTSLAGSSFAALELRSDLAAPDPSKLKTKGAAKDFEALLIGQMLHSVREDGAGWLGTGGDDAGSAAMGLGEEELAKAISSRGGFGLTHVIEAGLQKRQSPPVEP